MKTEQNEKRVEAIRSHQKESGMSKQAFSLSLNFSRSAVGNWLSGKRKVSNGSWARFKQAIQGQNASGIELTKCESELVNLHNLQASRISELEKSDRIRYNQLVKVDNKNFDLKQEKRLLKIELEKKERELAAEKRACEIAENALQPCENALHEKEEEVQKWKDITWIWHKRFYRAANIAMAQGIALILAVALSLFLISKIDF